MSAGGNDNGCKASMGEVSSHLMRQGERGTSRGAYKVEVGSSNPPDMVQGDYDHASEPHPREKPNADGV